MLSDKSFPTKYSIINHKEFIMPKKTTKTTKKSRTTKALKRPAEPSVLHRPTTWIMATLLLLVFVVCGISIYALKNVEPKTALSSAKLAVFDDLASEYIRDFEINSERPSVNEVTGYGISDEDGVFYITLDFTYYDIDESQTPKYQYTGLRHAIMYFWKDKERGTYSHAMSYHDDYYHPGGVYTEVGDHQLRDYFNQNQ